MTPGELTPQAQLSQAADAAGAVHGSLEGTQLPRQAQHSGGPCQRGRYCSAHRTSTVPAPAAGGSPTWRTTDHKEWPVLYCEPSLPRTLLMMRGQAHTYASSATDPL